MAAIVHSDPYAIFMRKIGYSVGLERTLERVGDLERLYVSTKDLTAPRWKELVTSKNCWKLKSHENITDVFYSLRFIQKALGDVLVLENLDATAIARILLKTSDERDRARAFLLLWAILTNDGEIFVNLLLARFQEGAIKEHLSAMVVKKRRLLTEILPGKDSAKRIYRTVTIERQRSNMGSARGNASLGSFGRREPLQEVMSLAKQAKFDPEKLEFSGDYFRKVPPRRKDWARSLQLWDDECGLTAKGRGFVGKLKHAGYIDEEGLFLFWPMDYELVRAGFRPDLLQAVKGLWDCLVDFAGAYAGVEVEPVSMGDVDDLVELIEKMMMTFRSLHTRKSMLRREMPITVAYPVLVALAVAGQKPLKNVPAALKDEQKGDRRRIAFRQSRNTGGALSLNRQDDTSA